MKRFATLAMIFALFGSMLVAAPSATAGTASQNPIPSECQAAVDNADEDDVIFAQAGVPVNGGSGSQVIIGSPGNDIIDGGSGNDIICGGGGNDTLSGGSGNDQIFGNEGDDDLFGNSGGDRLDGGTGGDVCDGGTGNNSEVNCEFDDADERPVVPETITFPLTDCDIASDNLSGVCTVDGVGTLDCTTTETLSPTTCVLRSPAATFNCTFVQDNTALQCTLA